jgi:hypothetical protein
VVGTVDGVVLDQKIPPTPPAIGTAAVRRGVPDPGGEPDTGGVDVDDVVVTDDQVVDLIRFEIDRSGDSGVEPSFDAEVLDSHPGDVRGEILPQDQPAPERAVGGGQGRALDLGIGRCPTERVEIDLIAHRVEVPLALLVEGGEMAVEKVAPLGAVAGPALDCFGQVESGAVGARDLPIEHVPTDPLDVHHRAAPIAGRQLAVDNLGGARLAVDLRVPPIGVTGDVWPPTHRQALRTAEQLIEAQGKETGIQTGVEIGVEDIGAELCPAGDGVAPPATSRHRESEPRRRARARGC